MPMYVDGPTAADLLSKTPLGGPPKPFVPPSKAPLPYLPMAPVPPPIPDPRGSTFTERIPHGKYPVFTDVPYGLSKAFGADSYPAEVLLHQRGYQVRPDKMTIMPDDLVRALLYQVPNKKPKI